MEGGNDCSKLEHHEVIAKLKDLAIDLGRTPLRREFEQFVSERRIRKLGGHTALVAAAGRRFAVSKVDRMLFLNDRLRLI
ncbi:hypothetical protein CCP2SC5_1020019 [Azospirillaceae bacterium]